MRGGPEIRAAVERATRDTRPAVLYEYVDTRGGRAKIPSSPIRSERPRKVPAYESSHVLIRAFYPEMGRSLDELEQKIAALTGCGRTEVIREHATLRPQVVALFPYPSPWPEDGDDDA